jgi:hypothetical protein
MRGAVLALLMLMLMPCTSAQAQSFDDMLEAALEPWRAASWYARTGNASVAALEAEEFRTRWRALAERFVSPPDPFGRDPAWSEMLVRIDDAAGSAADALGRDDAATGGRALRQVGDALAELRARNGIAGFSDRVAHYRDAVDRLFELSPDERLDRVDPSRIAALRGLTDRAAATVAALEGNVPERWRADPAMDGLLRQNRDGVAALAAALARPEAPSGLEVNGLIGVVRANYNLLFLRFGGALPASVAQVGAGR